jgi:hypothetical protein
MSFNVEQMMDIFSQLKDPKHRDLLFYYEDEGGNEQEFAVKSVGEFGISSDVVVTLEKTSSPICRPMSQYELDNLPKDAKKHLKKVMKDVKKKKK